MGIYALSGSGNRCFEWGLKMREQKELKVKLLVALGNTYLGPIDLTIWTHHKPEHMTSPVLDDALRIPPGMRTKEPRVLYSMRQRKILRPDREYDEQKVSDGDILLLTDSADKESIPALAQRIMEIETGS